MRRRLILSYLAVAAVILIVLEVPLGIVYARHEHDVATAGLQRDAGALASLAEEGVEHQDPTGLATLAQHYRTGGDSDVEIVGSDGKVLVRPRADESELATGSVGDRIHAVLNGTHPGRAPLGDGDELVAVAPIGTSVPFAGAVVVTRPDSAVDRRVRAAWIGLGLLAIGAMAAAAALATVVARSVTGPLTELESAAQRLGRGDLRARAEARGPAEVQALAGAFNDMAGRLEELIGAQHSFVADASHQLRSPLTAVRLRLENVAAAPAPADPAEIDAVLGEIDRLSRVVDGLLALARTEGERPARDAVDVAAVAAERRDAWAALAEEAGITLTYEGPDREVLALWVPGYLEQVLDNLLANAVEATPAGRTVRIAVDPNDGHPEVHVVDEGHGMSADDRQHAFDRLWRGADSRPGTGTGLGLSIVRQLSRTSGAEVELQAASGGGIDAVIRCAPADGGRRRPDLARSRPGT